MKSVVLLSGGLDSQVLAEHLISKGDQLYCLSIHYGQRHNKELAFANEFTRSRDLPHITLDLSGLNALLTSSSQTGNIPVPDGHYTENSMKLTVVPNRNMMLLSMAIAWAVDLKADRVAYAAHSGDHTIYPDCRPEFVEAMNRAAQLADWHQVQIYTPFVEMTKADIVKEGARLGLDFKGTWSCYKGLSEHCGACGTCVERKEAFELSGVPDPTIYIPEFESRGFTHVVDA